MTRISTPVLALLLAGTSPTFAQEAEEPSAQPGARTSDDERAHELYLHGDRLYAEGAYAAAIEIFREAYKLSGRPLLLFNLANAYERVGRYQDAAAALHSYEAHAPTNERESIARRILHLESRVGQAKAEAVPDAAPERRTDATAAATNATTNDGGLSSADASQQQQEPKAGDSTLGWALTGSGAVLLIAGGIAASVASAARLAAEDLCMGGICRIEARDAIDRDKTFSVLADVGFALGAGALVTGFVLLLITDSGDTTERAHLHLDDDGLGVGYSGTF